MAYMAKILSAFFSNHLMHGSGKRTIVPTGWYWTCTKDAIITLIKKSCSISVFGSHQVPVVAERVARPLVYSGFNGFASLGSQPRDL